MALNWTAVAGDFNGTLYADLVMLEAPIASERLNGVLVGGNFTIGIGFDMVAGGRPVQDAVLRTMGLKSSIVGLSQRPTSSVLDQKEYDFVQQIRNAVNSHKGSADLSAIMAQRAAAVQADPTYAAYIGVSARSAFSFVSESEVRQTFDSLWTSVYRQAILNKWPELQGDVGFASSKELIVLASMIWNGGPGILGNKLRAALQTGNRAEAWFEIRYGSNGGSSQSDGIAKRRYVESQLFGLYDSVGGASTDEAKRTYGMLTRHRSEILAYEAKYGVPPDGTSATRNTIALANSDPNLSAIATVQNLVQALTPARDALVVWINTQLPAGETALTAGNWNPAAIYLRASDMAGNVLDANGDNGKGAGLDKNLLVGDDRSDYLRGGAGDDMLIGNGGDDVLEGGAGADTMYGGAGDDTYVIDVTDGISNDRIVDSDNRGRIVVEGSGYTVALGSMQKDKGATGEVWKDPSGHITLTHNSPWRLTLDDGSVIELGESFDVTGFGISLLDAPEDPGNVLKGDFNKKINGSSYVTDANGYVANGSAQNSLDVINGGVGDDSISGLGGNDALTGGGGDDVVDGGDGVDVILGGSGADTLRGGAGDDFIYGSASGLANVPTSVSFTPPSAQGTEIARGFAWVAYDLGGLNSQGARYTIAGVGDILPNGERDSNLIDGGAGNDRIDSGSGADVALGGDGNDTIWGMAGADQLFGDADDDILRGDGSPLANSAFTPSEEHGDDMLSGGAGKDQLVGQGGNDELFGGVGNDSLWGDDTNPSETPNTLHGNDYVDGGDGDDQLVGGGKDDDLFGGIGNDNMFGDDNSENVPGSFHGQDYLDGEDGNDTLVGGGGADSLFGGEGADAMVGDDEQSKVPLAYQGADYMDGGAGNDLMLGDGGNDTLIGGDGDDQLGGDADLAQVPASAHGSDVLDGGNGNDTLDGGGGADVLTGGTGRDVLRGGEGNDVLIGGTEADYLAGGEGDDLYVIDAAEAGDGTLADTIEDTAGIDVVELSGVDSSTLQVLYNLDGSVSVAWSTTGAVYFNQGLTSSVATVQTGDSALVFSDLVGQRLATAVAVASARSNGRVLGGSNADQLTSSHSGTQIIGGRGDDRVNLNNGGGAVVSQTIGDGMDEITAVRRNAALQAGGPAPQNVLTLGTGINAWMLKLYRVGTNAFALTFNDNGDGVRFNAGTGPVEAIPLADWPFDVVSFADGSWITWSNVLASGITDARIPAATAGDDVFKLSPIGDYLDAGNGNDRIEGLAGNDTLLGRAGNDTLLGGVGNDSLYAGAGTDSLQGGDGNDSLFKDDITSWTQMEGGAGNDQYYLKIGTSYGGGVAFDNDVVSDDQYRISDAGTVGGFNQQTFTVRDYGGSDRLWMESTLITPTNTTVRYTGELLVLTSWNLTVSLADMVDANGSIDIDRSIEQVSFVNGIIWSPSDLIALALQATSGNDTIHGFAAAELIDGGAGNDSLYGGLGNDTVFGGAGYDYVHGDEGADTLNAGPGGGRLVGGAGDDTYVVNAGDGDVAIGSGATGQASDGGSDTLSMAALRSEVSISIDNTTYASSQISQVVVRRNDGTATATFLLSGASSEQAETIRFSNGELLNVASYVASTITPVTTSADNIRMSSLDDVVYSLDGNDSIEGWGGNDSLYGGAGNDLLVGGQGNDLLDGGLGNDTIRAESGDDRILFGTGSGKDSIYYDVLGQTFTNKLVLGDGIVSDGIAVEWRSASFSSGYSQTTGEFNGTFGGTQGSATLAVTLGTGADEITGTARFTGRGDLSAVLPISSFEFKDGTQLDLAGVVGRANQVTAGNDVLVDALNTGTLSGGQGDDKLYGLNGANTLDGQEGNDLLIGGDDEDVLMGGAGDDTLDGGFGNNSLQGGTGNDTLYGGFGDDVLDGGSGNDTMSAGYGNDTYMLRRGDGRDSITEAAGVDRIVLGNGIAPADVALFRFDADLILAMDQGATQLKISNHFSGAAFQIERIEFSDNAAWAWDSAAILANTTTGTPNSMVGTAGNDTFVVDNVGDVITEAANQGVDTIQSSVTYQTPTDVENILLTGYLDTAATGNGLANVLTGNRGNNRLDGQTGADTMVGGLGDDLYFVDNAGDMITELAGEGMDQVSSSINYTLLADVENLTLLGTVSTGTGNTLNNKIVGNTANNLLNGGAGNDTLDGGVGLGLDSLYGGTGDDVYLIDSGSSLDIVTELAGEGVDAVLSQRNDYVLGANVENLVLMSSAVRGSGNSLNNVLTGNVLNNELLGYTGNDTLYGGADGFDTLTGGAGDDTYIIDASGDLITEAAGEGTDTVQSDITYTLGSNIENLTLTGTNAINGTGNSLNNVMTGNSSNNTLDGQGGTDTLVGGGGDDLYILDVSTDVVNESLGAGTDTVKAAVNRTLDANVENLVLTGTALTGTGNALNNAITGNAEANTLNGAAGNDTLDGGIGTDTLVGGTGNDSYVVDATAEVVTESANEGTDTVTSSVTYTLTANVENLTLTGASAINATGNASHNVLTGNGSSNRLIGSAGNDTMIGGAGDDYYIVDDVGDVVTENSNEGTDFIEASFSYTLSGSNIEGLGLSFGAATALNATGTALSNKLVGNEFNNQLKGLAGDDSLYGDRGNDTLDGGAGLDVMDGGSGDDTYLVDSSADAIVEWADGGVDTVLANATYTLGANVENLSLGDIEIDGTGNGLANVVWGSLYSNRILGLGGNDWINSAQGNDYVDGGDGNDYLNGLTGADTLIGSEGDDTLEGSYGADSLVGGNGNDTYYSDSNDAPIVEGVNGGIDTMLLWGAGDSIHLSDNVENAGVLAWDDEHGGGNITGNALDNKIVGSAGMDNFLGAEGNDTLLGDLGNDWIDGGIGADSIDGGGDGDWLYGGAGNDTVNGGADADLVDGQDDADALRGGDGNDTIFGGAGVDLLMGQGGNDSLVGGDGDDSLYDDQGNNTLDGGDGNDFFSGGSGNDSMLGGNGNDYFSLNSVGSDFAAGGAGNDFYMVYPGLSGTTIVEENDATPGNTDAINFNNLNPYQLLFRQSGNNLVISQLGNAGNITVKDWYLGSARQVETLTASGNSQTAWGWTYSGSLQSSKVANLVSAMAAFTPAAGQLEITNTAVRAAIDQAWGTTGVWEDWGN